MTTVNGLPAHILLVHAIVVLLPLSALLLVLSSVWPKARGKLAAPNAVLAVIALILVPITTDAGEWLERRVPRTQLLRDHTELGDTALWVAIPVAVLALVVWWRQRENATVTDKTDVGAVEDNAAVATAVRRKTYLAPASTKVTTVIAVVAVLVAGATLYDVYRIGDSGAQASWQGKFSENAAPRGTR
ncbi:DUF2231 domain-containing protein [Amycolatopsis nivea]|uniref:DUF2231 domain-containing protein n=1 Tax=Amycolatopsis nivea TaxID=1644109 RepID=UPI00106F3AF9|nr:DUF2231 domain-containing protein [Amycolatopsis nivea]